MCSSEYLLLYTYIVSVGDRRDAGRTFKDEDDEHEDQVLLNNASHSFIKHVWTWIIKRQSFVFLSSEISQKHTNSMSDRLLFIAA